VVLTDFKLFQESVSIGEGSPLKQNILLLEELELDHNQNDFSVSFAALDFSNPQKIQYKYILENHDEGWIYVGHNNTASYTNMDPGKYTFKVLATNGDGIWNEQVKSFRIIIHPPWWLTIWAYGFYALIFAIGVFGVDRIMRNRLIRKERDRSRAFKLEQAKKIEQAYNELKSTQSQLIQSEKMASLGELTAGIAHEIQNPLNFVNNFAEVSIELIEEMNEKLTVDSWQLAGEIADDLKQNLEKINHHGKRADAIVKGMLQHSRTSTGVKEPTDINALADEYLRLAFHGLRAKNKSFNADFRAELDPTLPKINVIPQDFGRVMLNLINNAFYAVSSRNLSGISNQAGLAYKPTVTVTTRRSGDHIEIRVKDNGTGIPQPVIDKIFQPFFTTKPAGEGTGLGLSMSYDIITNGHGGTIEVKTKEGEGTEFIIVLPL
jgi:signal transduction histidine kinase